MKRVICDICKKVLTKKEGIRQIEINRVDNKSFENYPGHFDAIQLLAHDLCLKCYLKINREINRIKKVKE